MGSTFYHSILKTFAENGKLSRRGKLRRIRGGGGEGFFPMGFNLGGTRMWRITAEVDWGRNEIREARRVKAVVRHEYEYGSEGGGTSRTEKGGFKLCAEGSRRGWICNCWRSKWTAVG